MPIFDALLRHGDRYMLLADYDVYVKCQDRVEAAFRDPRAMDATWPAWGPFSVDRLVRE